MANGDERAAKAAALPFEFVVLGEPVSHQTNDRALLRAWRELVRAAAQRRWSIEVSPLDSRLKITAVHFHEGNSVRVDNDNMLKPMQDALIGIVYQDDRQITDSVVRKTAIDGAFFVRRMPAVIAESFAHGQPFVYLRIEAAPDHRELL